MCRLACRLKSTLCFAVVLALAAAALGTRHALAATELPLPTRSLNASEWKLGVGMSYLDTSENFDRNGSKLKLPGANSFQSFEGILYGEYGATREITLLGQLPLVYNSAIGVTTSSPNVSRTNTGAGAGDLQAGLRYEPLHYDSLHAGVRLGFDALIQFPLYSRLEPDEWATFRPDGLVALGTGVTEFTFMGRAELPLGIDWSVNAGAGFTARTGGFSDLFPYEAYLKFERRRGFLARAGLRGQASVSDDEFSSLAPDKLPNDRATTASAGSEVYNAVNPARLAVSLAAGSYFGDSFYALGGVDFPVAGKNVPAQPYFTLALGLDLGGADDRPRVVSRHRGFQQYYLASKVIRVSHKLRQILIDRGAGDLIKKGEILDIFEPDRTDGRPGELIARGRVLEVGPTKSKIQIIEYAKESTVQVGFIVRRPVQ